ncbi:hypothetical protein P7C71_g5119, partial [Lecanoromycetidae sp. Uapishka_2]
MDMGRNRDTLAPAPLPAFEFPVRRETSSETISQRRSTSNQDAAGPPHSRNRSRPQQLSIDALPAFDFGPAASVPINNSPSPPRSPSRRTPPLHSLGGHRRNGSEFVGGDITNGGPVLVSSSPTKSEYPVGHRRDGSGVIGGTIAAGGPITTKPLLNKGASHSQPDLRLGPPTTRRGHAHRRSGAISSHDVSMILKPSSDTKGGSAPTTPSDAMFQQVLPPVLDRSISQPVLSASTAESSEVQSEENLSNDGGQLRSRVRISDVLEYIPRPLSTISSETSSSISTIRANHSLTNSVTSFFSAGTSSPPPANLAASRRGQSFSQDHTRSRSNNAAGSSRPSSVDWDFDFTGSKVPVKRPSSALAHDSSPKATTESFDETAPERLPDGDQAFNEPPSNVEIPMPKLGKSADAMLTDATNVQYRRRMNPSTSSPCIRPRTSPEPKVTKRQRKGRSWHELLSRKGKPDVHRQVQSRRSPTPPLRKPSPEPEFSLDDINFDDDTDCIIETASPYIRKPPRIETDHSNWKPRESSPLSDADGSASMLDIDAALGSLESPGFGPTFEDAIGVNALSSKRRMHSSGATGGFAGPGMHYHRRAESAPELEAVDRSRFGFPRLGSNPAMAIEEEEEEPEEDELDVVLFETAKEVRSSQEEQEEVPASELGVNIVEAASVNEAPVQRRRRRTNDEGVRTPKDENPTMPPDFAPVEIVGAEEEPRFSVVTKSSDESTITPTLSHDPTDIRSGSVPLDFAMSTPALTYGTPETPSAVSSPDFTRTSFDVPRLHTANSSITDRGTLNSSRAGDQGLGLHGSVDDVPSLTSSASTMSAHPPRISSSANSGFSADRSSSVSAAVPARTRPVSAHKRLSLASLTRLAGSSYNRSKLNITESAPPETVEQKEKKKKGHRISRLMKFWKSKEKLSSST